MLTPEDIKALTDAHVEAQKLHFYTKEGMDAQFYNKTEMDEKFSTIQTVLDKLVTKDQTQVVEETTLVYRVKKTEDWIDKAAPKLDIKFEH